MVLEVEAGKYLAKTSRRLAHAQRAVAGRTLRGPPSSANRNRAVELVGCLHERTAQRRNNALHTYPAALVKADPLVVLETLATKNLMSNRHLGGSIADEGWGELGRQLTYKATWAGGQVLLAPRFFSSSTTCAGCGAVKPKLSLSERTYRARVCALVLDRDVNTAAVPPPWGEHQRGTCPCGDSPARTCTQQAGQTGLPVTPLEGGHQVAARKQHRRCCP